MMVEIKTIISEGPMSPKMLWIATLAPDLGFPIRNKLIKEKNSLETLIPERVNRKLLGSLAPPTVWKKVAACETPTAGRKPTVIPAIDPKNIDFIIWYLETSIFSFP